MFKQNGLIVETYLDFINDSISKVHGTSLQGKKILELGDNDPTYDLQSFVSKGMEHTLIEPYHEGEDGNLAGPYMPRIAEIYIPKMLHKADNLSEYMNYFDVITNIGCLEHIIPLELHYDIWKNLHDMCKVGGVMIHIMPDDYECFMYLRWLGHCTIYFSTEFFENLASKLGYEIVNNELLNFNRSVALKKTTNSTFNLNKSEFLATFHTR